MPVYKVMTKKYAYILAATILSAAFTVQAQADIYKFVDEEGVVHFSNVPVSTEAKKVVKESTLPKPEKKSNAQAKAPDPAPEKKSACEGMAGGELKPDPQVGPVARPAVSSDADVPYADIIKDKCDKYGVDTGLVKSIIKAESNFNASAVSNKGARGLMQLMPSTASDMSVMNSFDPEQNIDGGVRYLRFLLDTFDGDVELSVAAYNCGQGRVIRNGNTVPEISETKNYVKKVLKYSKNPMTGATLTRPIYKVEMKDGSVIFTETPIDGANCSRVE